MKEMTLLSPQPQAQAPTVVPLASKPRKKILAVASGGGHWIQLRRMMPAFEDHTIVYVTTYASYRDSVAGHTFHTVRDANLNDKLGLFKMAWQLVKIIDQERPDVIISTGAAPGYFAIRIGKVFQARTIWVDSIANAEVLSTSGAKIGKHVDLWLTQWPHLATPNGPFYHGAVL